VYTLSLQKTITPSDLLLSGLSQAYLQTFQPAALAITYGHLLNADPVACGLTATNNPYLCALPLGGQNNVIGIEVTAGSTVVATYKETVRQTKFHDGTPNDTVTSRGDQAFLLPLGKM
jgi:hypothetical protein